MFTLTPTIKTEVKYLCYNKVTGYFWDGNGFNVPAIQVNNRAVLVDGITKAVINYTYENVGFHKYDIESS